MKFSRSGAHEFVRDVAAGSIGRIGVGRTDGDCRRSRPVAKDDATAILGHWLVVESKANGQRLAEKIGAVYTFKDNNLFEVFASD